MNYDVFLSYSGEDEAWAQRLYRRLRRFRVDGGAIRIFFAPAAVRPGDSIPRSVSQALEKSRSLFAVITPAWLASEWTRLEQDSVLMIDPSGQRRRLIPLLLKTAPLPPEIARLKYVDFRDPDDYERALRELVGILRDEATQRSQEWQALGDRRAVLSAPVLPWLGFSGPSFDFVWPEMIIDPLVLRRRHPSPQVRLSEWTKAPYSRDQNCFAVIGEPGAGKTTALRSMLLGGGGWLPSERLLVHARELVTRSEHIRTRADREPDGLAVLVDGLDEAGAANLPAVGEALTAVRRSNVVVIIASRTDFFERQFDILEPHLQGLEEIVELRRWEIPDVLDFSRRYASRVGEDGLASTVEEIVTKTPATMSILGNPMRLTLLLYLLATGATVDALNLKEPYSLYQSFYSEWLKKERQRGTGGRDARLISSAHASIARWIYINRGETVDVHDLVTRETADVLDRDSAFLDLLNIVPGDDRVTTTGFRHETLGEFILAREVLGAFESGGADISTALRITFADDVNFFVRSGMNASSRSRVQLYERNLTSLYSELLGRDGDAERLREQLLYYIGRLPLRRMPSILRQAYEEEASPLLRRAAALGAIIFGDEATEAEYLALLEQPDEARLNRSVQMVYFGDVHDDLHSFVDNGEDWSRTRGAIYRRLANDTARDRRLRWWDLRTLRSFYDSRGYEDPVAPGERDTLLSFRARAAAESVHVQRELRLLLEKLGVEPVDLDDL